MVKHLSTLALRAMQTNQSVLSHLTRIQHGFLPEKNIQEAEHVVAQLQELLRDMKSAMSHPKESNSDKIIPLK